MQATRPVRIGVNTARAFVVLREPSDRRLVDLLAHSLDQALPDVAHRLGALQSPEALYGQI
jgi:hypothetical protein